MTTRHYAATTPKDPATMTATRARLAELRARHTQGPWGDITAPIHVAGNLADHVAALEKYQPDEDIGWTVRTDPSLGRRWVVAFNVVTLTVGDRGDIRLAMAVLRARQEARSHLRTTVLEAVHALGLPHRRFMRPPGE